MTQVRIVQYFFFQIQQGIILYHFASALYGSIKRTCIFCLASNFSCSRWHAAQLIFIISLQFVAFVAQHYQGNLPSIDENAEEKQHIDDSMFWQPTAGDQQQTLKRDDDYLFQLCETVTSGCHLPNFLSRSSGSYVLFLILVLLS